MDYKKLCFQVQEIAKQAGNFIREERKKISSEDVELKSAASLVTYVDKNSEKQIVEALSQLIPGSGFVAEEGTAISESEKFKWFVDPVDGTTNYIHGIPAYSVSIGLSENEEMILGVVYDVAHDEMFYAWKDSPAFSNGSEIKVATSKNSEDTLIATGFPYYDFEKTDLYIEALKELMKNTRGIRRLGSAAIDLCYVAAGRFDAFYEHALHAWDVAAGVFILQQAGGRTTDFNGGNKWLFGGELISASNNYFPEFFKIINHYLGKNG